MRGEFSSCGENCECVENLLIRNMPFVGFPGGGPEGGSQFGITILEISSPSPLTLRNWIMNSDIPEAAKQKRLDAIETMVIAGAEREVLRSSPILVGQKGGPPIELPAWQESVWFVNTNRLYELDYLSGSTEQFDKDTDVFKKMLSSFELIKKPEGWPIKIEGYYSTTSIIPIDTTGDRKLELITDLANSESLGWEHQIFIWDTKGYLLNWQHQFTTGTARTPSIGDINKDGRKEIIVGALEDSQGFLCIFNGDGEIIKKILVGGAGLGTPTLSDINDDGKDEIIIAELSLTTSESGNSVYVFNKDGSIVSGWPQKTEEKGIYGKIAVGDLDNDGKDEIIGFTYSGKLYVWHSDGTLMEGNWPYAIDVGFPTPTAGFCSPVLADLDNDGNIEIILGTERNEVYVFNYDGTLFDGNNDGEPEWPKRVEGMVFDSIAVGDIDDDNNPDIVVGTLGGGSDDKARIYIWNNQGNVLSNWPIIVEPKKTRTLKLTSLWLWGILQGMAR